MSRRILVTGACGYLGRHVVREAASLGEVSALDMVGEEVSTPPELSRLWRASVLEADILARACEGMDTVIHLAAMANIFAGTPADIMRVNVVGTWNVLEAAEAAGVRRVVLCSSDSVTGLTVRPDCMTPPRYLPIDTDHPSRPTDPYGLSKKLGEEAGRCMADRGRLEVMVLRPVYVLYPRVVDEVLRRARDPGSYVPSLDPVSPKAGGGPFWHYVKPEDAACAFRQAVDAPMSQPFEQAFVLADETLHPRPTLERARELFGHVPEIRDARLYEDNPYAPIFDTGAARRLLGFTAPTGMRAALHERLRETV
ncbi:nucleoside-diphosphate-sugar epimerase [Ancylobacter aquaticus]|uniref:Nucleoside-diphosphate-sugar epimerase n=1 Tax=Ancylobacter aquaticus TaxID=100 RepID=A0A4R1I203_ANCAQ|nr:NAD(P)-dependent oxidoreductase [Ancylobacter aquaticus]TCK29214.1 nucleoside-diphosphate-sugar epimerase [Ancylobacter aquaticus]